MRILYQSTTIGLDDELIDEGCQCCVPNGHPPCNFCVSLDCEQADAYHGGGRSALRDLILRRVEAAAEMVGRVGYADVDHDATGVPASHPDDDLPIATVVDYNDSTGEVLLLLSNSECLWTISIGEECCFIPLVQDQHELSEAP